MRLLLKLQRNERNTIEHINTLSIPLLKYESGLSTWSVDELVSFDRKTRKMLTRYGTLYLNTDTDRAYIQRDMCVRGLIGWQHNINVRDKKSLVCKNITENMVMKLV